MAGVDAHRVAVRVGMPVWAKVRQVSAGGGEGAGVGCHARGAAGIVSRAVGSDGDV